MTAEELWKHYAEKETLTKQDIINMGLLIRSSPRFEINEHKKRVFVRLAHDRELSAFISSDEFHAAMPTKERWEVPNGPTFFLLTPQMIRDRLVEFRRLTMPDPKSNMNRTIDSILSGDHLLVAAFAVEDKGVLIGWACIDRFKGKFFIDVFVHEDHRKKGIGAILVGHVIDMFKQGTFDAPLICDSEPTGFWNKFPEVK